MKHMKKLVTLLLALIMALALVVPASAYAVDNRTPTRPTRSLAVHRVPKVNQLWGMSSGVTASRVLNFCQR